jgi:hypothetical protein
MIKADFFYSTDGFIFVLPIYRVSATGNTGNNNTIIRMVKLMPTEIMVMTSPRIK